jgi:hypothetical protein
MVVADVALGTGAVHRVVVGYRILRDPAPGPRGGLA